MATGLGQMEGGNEPWLQALGLGGQTLGRMFNGMGNVMSPGNGGFGGMGGFGQGGMGGFGQGGNGGFGQAGNSN